MPTYAETILARYNAVEREADSFGRIITVGRLRPAEAQAVRRLADSDRTTVMAFSMVAGCVREIDDGGSKVSYRPPRTEADLAIVLNALDEEGLTAAIAAYERLTKADAPATDGGVAEAAKNTSQTTT